MQAILNIPSQVIDVQWKFVKLSVNFVEPIPGVGKFIASVTYEARDNNKKLVDTKTLSYSGKDYNTWWDNFNSGAFLYNELISKTSVTNAQIPPTVEGEFLNT